MTQQLLRSLPVLDNIVTAKVMNHEHQQELLKELRGILMDGGFKLLVIDSVMARFRQEFVGRFLLPSFFGHQILYSSMYTHNCHIRLHAQVDVVWWRLCIVVQDVANSPPGRTLWVSSCAACLTSPGSTTWPSCTRIR